MQTTTRERERETHTDCYQLCFTKYQFSTISRVNESINEHLISQFIKKSLHFVIYLILISSNQISVQLYYEKVSKLHFPNESRFSF